MITRNESTQKSGQAAPTFQYQVEYVGQDRQPVLIIDNAFQQAEKLVDYCVANLAFHQADSFYPGIRMPGPANYDKFLARQLGVLMHQVFGTPIEKIRGARSVYSMVVTPPEALALTQRVPHSDSLSEQNLACVHYLCESRQGGTSLYRHRSTGYENINEQRYETYQAALTADMKRYGTPAGYINGSTEIFERTASYEARFNRLVMYRGFNLHSGNIAPDFAFDANPRSGRLTLNTFYFF